MSVSNRKFSVPEQIQISSGELPSGLEVPPGFQGLITPGAETNNSISDGDFLPSDEQEFAQQEKVPLLSPSRGTSSNRASIPGSRGGIQCTFPCTPECSTYIRTFSTTNELYNGAG